MAGEGGQLAAPQMVLGGPSAAPWMVRGDRPWLLDMVRRGTIRSMTHPPSPTLFVHPTRPL